MIATITAFFAAIAAAIASWIFPAAAVKKTNAEKAANETAKKIRDASGAATAEDATKVLAQVALLDIRTASEACRIAVAQALALRRKWVKKIEQNDFDGLQRKILTKTRKTAESAAEIALDVLKKSLDNYKTLRLLAKHLSKEAASKALLLAPPTSMSTMPELLAFTHPDPPCWYCKENDSKPVYGWITTDTGCHFVCPTCHGCFQMNDYYSFECI